MVIKNGYTDAYTVIKTDVSTDIIHGYTDTYTDIKTDISTDTYMDTRIHT